MTNVINKRKKGIKIRLRFLIKHNILKNTTIESGTDKTDTPFCNYAHTR